MDLTKRRQTGYNISYIKCAVSAVLSVVCALVLGVEELSVNFSLSALFVLVSVGGVFLVFNDLTVLHIL